MPGEPVEAFDHDLPPLVELGDHGRDRILRAGERGKPGILRRSIDAGMQIDRELARVVVELARPYRIAEPPAGHGVGLRPAIEQNKPIADRRILQQADVGLAVVEHVVVDLVRHDGDVGMAFEPSDELVDLGLRRHAAGRVGRRIDNQEPRLRRDQAQRFLGGEGEIVLLADRHRHRPRAGELDHRAVDGKARIGIEDVRARLPEHQDRHEHRRLAAGEDHHRVGLRR